MASPEDIQRVEDEAEYVELQIKSAGNAWNTVVSTSDGVPIANIKSVTWTCDTDSYAQATIVIEHVKVDVVGDPSAQCAPQPPSMTW